MGGSFKLVKEETGISGVWLVVVVGLCVPLVFTVLMAKKKMKQRGELVTDMGEEGDLIMQNRRFKTLVQVPWEGATNIPVLFEQASKKYANSCFLGSRRVISREVTTSGDGRTFEKLYLVNMNGKLTEKFLIGRANFHPVLQSLVMMGTVLPQYLLIPKQNG